MPHDISNIIMDTFYETSVVCHEYVIGNYFTPNSEMSLAEYGLFFTFREGKSIQSDIENFISDFKTNKIGLSIQNISKQRMFIKPEYFQSLNREFICRIDYNILNLFYRSYKGFFVYAIE